MMGWEGKGKGGGEGGETFRSFVRPWFLRSFRDYGKNVSRGVRMGERFLDVWQKGGY